MCEMCGQNSNHGFAPTRRGLLLGGSATGLVWASGARAKETKAPPKPENAISSDAALKRLKDGNGVISMVYRGAMISSTSAKRSLADRIPMPRS